jgi:alcohol dehydrogenase
MVENNPDIELESRKFVAPEFVFGLDARLLAASYCKKLSAKTIFLATDPEIKQTNWFHEIENQVVKLKLNYLIYSNISPNPRDYEVMEGASVFKENDCNIILAVGGGSVIDCAKGIGIISSNHKHISEYEGVDKIHKPIPPMVCIPSTSGASADVSQFAIINNIEKRYKMAIISKAIVPDISLVDPLVLCTMPPFLNSCTGMDALSHAMEAFVSNASSSFTDMYAIEAIKLIHHNLELTLKSPNDLQARGKMMLASLYAGLAFSNASLGCVHSMAHSLGGFLDLPHGECNAILLPHVVNFNFNSAVDKYKKVAKIFEIPLSGLNSSQIQQKLVEYLFEFKNIVGITSTLGIKGVTKDIVPLLSEKSIKDPCNATNPRTPVEKDHELIFNEAI